MNMNGRSQAYSEGMKFFFLLPLLINLLGITLLINRFVYKMPENRKRYRGFVLCECVRPPVWKRSSLLREEIWDPLKLFWFKTDFDETFGDQLSVPVWLYCFLFNHNIRKLLEIHMKGKLLSFNQLITFSWVNSLFIKRSIARLQCDIFKLSRTQRDVT